MIKIDFTAFIREHVWFGWQWVPGHTIIRRADRYLQPPAWYWLGYPFAFWPVRKRFEGTYPKWYAELFGFRQ